MIVQKPENFTTLGKSSCLEDFTEDFKSSYFHKTLKEVSAISVLSDEAWRFVWNPDVMSAAARELRRNKQAHNKNADEIYKQQVILARQSPDVPRNIVRQLDQLRPDLFPVQSALVCPVLVSGIHGMPGEYNSGRPEREDLYYSQGYFRVHEWLSTLPIGPKEQVYFARKPSCTLVIEWDEFLRYWDAFYCDRFCYANVCDETNEWFLFMHGERFMVFGCTESHALKFDISHMPRIPKPIDYGLALSLEWSNFERFRKSLIADALKRPM